MKYFLFFLVVIFSFSSIAKPYLIEDHLKQLSSKKRDKKWTLKDFVTGKKSSGKKASPVPKISVLPSNIKDNPKTEFSLGIEYGNLNLDTDGVKDRFEVYRATLTAFVRFAGVLGHFYLTENSKENHGDLSLAIRLVGTSQQTTHLMLFYGVNKTKEFDGGVLKNVNNFIWGGELVLYFIDMLAASYKLTHMEENTESDIALRRSGRRHEIRVFLDFNYFRVFGTHTLEVLEFKNTNFIKRESQGLMGGVMLFF